ncbi:MAG: BLUF domain-containing protein [Bacteroidota bacterium]
MYKYISYISEQACILSEVEIRRLLFQCRTNNRNLGITGVLIHFNGIFTQFFEGPEESIDYVYEKIKQDKRHGNLKELLCGYDVNRYYKDWTMAYRPLQRQELTEILGFRKLDKRNLFANPSEVNHLGINILKNFVDGLHMK